MPRHSWTKRQRVIRRCLLDRMRLWQREGKDLSWLNLTGARGADERRLRRDFQALRKRIERQFGFLFEYVCVDTREGNGVIHAVIAGPRGNFIPQRWLSRAWDEIHGGPIVWVSRVGKGDGDNRRLSRYMVAQYCGDQYGLVRLSQSRCDVPITRMRTAWHRALGRLVERYEWASRCWHAWGPEASEQFGRWFRIVYQRGWEELLCVRSTAAHGVTWAWVDGELVRV